MVSESPAVCWLCLCTQSKGQSHFQALPTPLVFDCSLAPPEQSYSGRGWNLPLWNGTTPQDPHASSFDVNGIDTTTGHFQYAKIKTNLHVTLMCMFSRVYFSTRIIETIPAFITTAFTTVSLRFHISEVNRLVIVGYLDIKGDKGLRCQQLLSCEFKACHHVSLMRGLISGCQI